MIEALGRKVNNGDVVIVKKGAYGANFELGAAWEKSVILKNGIFKSYSTYYLIENPTEYEKNTVKTILENYQKKKAEEKATKIKMEMTPLKEIKAGDFGYLTDSDRISIYLGKCDICIRKFKIANMTNKAENEDANEIRRDMHVYVSLAYNIRDLTLRMCIVAGEYLIDNVEELNTYNTSIIKNKKAFRKGGVLGNLRLPSHLNMNVFDSSLKVLIYTKEYMQGGK